MSTPPWSWGELQPVGCSKELQENCRRMGWSVVSWDDLLYACIRKMKIYKSWSEEILMDSCLLCWLIIFWMTYLDSYHAQLTNLNAASSVASNAIRQQFDRLSIQRYSRVSWYQNAWHFGLNFRIQVRWWRVVVIVVEWNWIKLLHTTDLIHKGNEMK